jgi:Xaa-Pro aminopeptidase
MTDPLLLFADTERSADLFHAIPHAITDPFLYAELDGGRRVAVVGALDADTVRSAGVETIDPYAFGVDELLAAGADEVGLWTEISLRACRELGVRRAVVPPDFPLAHADHLRAGGVELAVDAERFTLRRRVKTPAQLEGIRRAQAAADAAMAVAARLIGELRSSEEIRFAMQATCEEHGATLADEAIVAHGPQGAVGHETGSGPLVAGEPVVVDIWPRDRASRCFTDMTRTFVAGAAPPPDELARWHGLCRASLDVALAELRPGASTRAVFERSLEPLHSAGVRTQLTKEPGEVLVDGAPFSLGHGVGLEVHEAPGLGRIDTTLLAGDVLAVEPCIVKPGVGGCRIEDVVLVTDDRPEVLSRFPRELA